MEPNLLIKYTEQNEASEGYDLGLLGESFSGFNDVFKELFEISEMQGDLVIKTTSISEGSIDVHNLIQVISSAPFHDVKDLLNFLQVVDHSLYEKASEFFSEIGNGHKTVNDFFNHNQFDSNLITALIAVYFPSMISWAGKQKDRLFTRDENGNTLPEAFAKKLQQMIKKGKYKKVLKPLTENNVSKMQVAATRNSGYMVSIDETNLGNYLPDDEKILPDLENGSVHTFTGEILALQSTKGETLKVKVHGIDPKYQLLVAHPTDGKKTEDYKDFYKQQINLKVEIYRKTFFKRPELIIKEIKPLQGKFF